MGDDNWDKRCRKDAAEDKVIEKVWRVVGQVVGLCQRGGTDRVGHDPHAKEPGKTAQPRANGDDCA